ncbi:phage portal protein [Holdemania sp. 1001095H_141210_F2]|uniref:phage portal protein n=1 Tax=Holdemania sp. 1001095H_141210_F2 TaxID=2787149 RepID=UPI00189CBFE5|nr:phage portal protein [Holdemania sp. 1001095H_141210_F2]
MLTENEIVQFIQEDTSSDKKRFARVGQKYYEGEHDIRNYRLYYYNADGQLVEDKSRSNIKISHPFFTELVDQEVQYMLSGKDGFVKSDIPELQNELDEYFNENEDFTSELYEVLTGAITKGFEYMYAYKTVEDKIGFQCADSLGVVEVRAKDTQDGCDYVIYWYVDRIAKENKKIKRIQVWDKSQTYFYVQEEDGKLEKDESVEINPRPHTIYSKGDGALYYENFGFIPFFRLDNCRKQFSGLKSVKELIDDYDLMSCGLSNNLQDANEYLVVVSGFQGDNLEELIQNTKTKKHIGVDTGGDVDFKTVDVPYEARKTKLELDEKNIYRFGMGFNSAQMGDGNITNIVIKSRYALLDLKCNKLEIRLRQFMRKILKIVLKEINDNNGTDYQQKDVYFNFEREVMTNASDNAIIEKTDAETEQVKINTLLNLASTLDQETIVQNICDVLDIDYEEIKDRLPEDDVNLIDAQSEIDNVVVDEPEVMVDE